ncbi:DNA cytosine methyltransferase [Mucilaginibacter xinganensis]|uniref:Cytosine-specific methyltransferase n=1 Tax=Mucilaginibacter xinganensis TaxID=1234841 RepID=A0A223NRI1_9SPHI|nr:DNA cytosine methyltransferase [Mucilaginibacter xinganensis]ASU32515.1 hypothetical protein MuYL_0612 [Mucilaginibacter xinganensis]
MYSFVSLFSGCGGFDKGFIDQGFKCLGAYDIDPIAVEVYNQNIGEYAKVYDLSTAELPENIKGSIDIVLSGSPCQGFSTAGKRRVEDPRNKLLLVGGQIAVRLNAKYFIAENVMGSVSGEHKLYWNELEKYMIDNGYHVEFHKCDATKIGLPQSRKRIIMIAARGAKKIDIEMPLFEPVSLKDVFNNIDSAPNHDKEYLSVNSSEYKIALKIKPGQKLSNVRGGERAVHTWNIPSVFGSISQIEEQILLEIMGLRRKIRNRDFGDADPVDITTLKSRYDHDISENLKVLIAKGYLRDTGGNTIDLAHTFNGKYRRLCYTKVSPTVDTRFGNPKYFLHPEEHRAITVREAARIQGFPDSFIFKGNKAEQYRMIGNAVPPKMSHWLAAQLNKILNAANE